MRARESWVRLPGRELFFNQLDQCFFFDGNLTPKVEKFSAALLFLQLYSKFRVRPCCINLNPNIRSERRVKVLSLPVFNSLQLQVNCSSEISTCVKEVCEFQIHLLR